MKINTETEEVIKHVERRQSLESAVDELFEIIEELGEKHPLHERLMGVGEHILAAKISNQVHAVQLGLARPAMEDLRDGL